MSTFIIIVSVFQGLIALIHYAVYRTVVHYFGIYSQTGLWIFRVFMFLAAISFIVASIITSKGWTAPGHVFYTVSAVWLGLVIWLFFASVLCVILDPIAKHYINNEVVYWGVRATIALVCFIGAVALNVYGLVHQSNLQVVEYEVPIKNLPNEWEGKKAVLIADTHFGNVRGAEYAKDLKDKISTINPIIMFLSGDIYDGPPIPFEAPINELASFKPQWGTYFVTGNHEEYGDREMYIAPIQKAGIKVLEDESVNVKGVNIAGVSYRNSSTKDSSGNEQFAFVLSKIFNTTASTTSNSPTILLKHTPAGVASAHDTGIDLMLSGHTHRGQMWPFGYIAKLVFNGFEYGLNEYKGLQVITTSGAGTWGPPQRIGTSNEIVVIKFKKS